MKKISSIAILMIYSQIIAAQSAMDKGFKMLEGGQFKEAAIFFKNYLKTDSLNQTALLCYGRGTGLSGNTDEAKGVFKKLQSRFPNNYEIDLNMAEAYMWSKDFKTALDLYANLVDRDSTNFAALLGYANAFSENKKYIEALKYVEKALKVSPENSNALVSRKYMRLGRAGTLANDEKFDEAIQLYNLILQENSKDTDALINKAQVLMSAERFIEAKRVYELLVGIPEKKSDAYLGLSMVANRLKSNENAMFWAEKAVATADSTNFLKTKIGLINAYGWKKDFKTAFELLAELQKQYPNNSDVISGYGRLSIWSKNFAKGAQFYQSLLKMVPSSFDGNLGFADANHAQGLDNKSFEFVRKTLGYFPNQRDALHFLEKLHIAHDPTVSSHIYFSRDNGGNISENYKTKITFDPHSLIRTSIFYNSRTARSITDKQSKPLTISQVGLGMSYRVSGKIRFFSEASMVQTPQYKRIVGEIGSELNIGKFQIAEIKYFNELQNFTASLIESNLKMDNIQLNYNLSLPSKIGLYSQLIHTSISDGNKRNLLFASLYYDLVQSPVLKSGINYSLFSFQKQVPLVYFSPNIFKGYELFIATENVNEVKAKWLYQAILAGGLQQISSESPQAIYRFDIKTGYKFSKRLWAMGYFMRSNSAASSVQGFTYNETGIKLQYIIPARLL